jgi:hypothetical protein
MVPRTISGRFYEDLPRFISDSETHCSKTGGLKAKSKTLRRDMSDKSMGHNWARFTLHVVAFIPHEGHVLNLTL